MKNSDLFLHENDYADFESDAAVKHLSGAIQINTTSYVDTTRIDYTQFERFHAYLMDSYPLVMAHGIVEKIGYSLLIMLPGSDAALKPALFMAHQDVVPVKAGTEKDWIHGPFSGDVSDGFIWGRGTMDIKEMLIGILEAAEYLLKQGKTFARTVYLAFGEDEETCSVGARAISNLLKARGVELEFVLDEGSGDVISGEDYGAPDILACSIGIYEKGYADVELFAPSKGGHSSNPFHGTSLGNLAKSIAAIVDHPLLPMLPDCVVQTLEQLKPWITEAPMAEWVKDIEKNKQEILNWFLSHKDLYYQVMTTAAPTMITEGSPAGNVMPQNMSAVINFRLAAQDTTKQLLAHCKKLAHPDVEVKFVQKIDASVPSDIGAFGYASLKEVLEYYFDRLHFFPALNKGATDARNYEQICRCCLRFGPFLEEEDISREGIHGTNERISIRAYLQGIRVLIRMMEKTCIDC